MTKFQLQFAAHDAAHCLAPGLFQSLKKGDRESQKLNVKYQFNEDTYIEFSGPQPLGVDDMRVLQGLVALASASRHNRQLLTGAETGMQETELRDKLSLTDAATGSKVVAVNAHYVALAREIGYNVSGGSTYAQIRDCIERIWKVSVVVQHKKRRYGYRILSHYASDADTGVISVALNPRLTLAILAPRQTEKRQYLRLDMTEVRGLRTDPARLMHQRLHWLPTNGQRGTISINRLCEYVWQTEVNDNAMRARRHTVVQALEELVAIGWSVERSADAPGLVKIRRPTASKALYFQDGEDADAVDVLEPGAPSA